MHIVQSAIRMYPAQKKWLPTWCTLSNDRTVPPNQRLKWNVPIQKVVTVAYPMITPVKFPTKGLQFCQGKFSKYISGRYLTFFQGEVSNSVWQRHKIRFGRDLNFYNCEILPWTDIKFCQGEISNSVWQRHNILLARDHNFYQGEISNSVRERSQILSGRDLKFRLAEA